MTIRNFFLIFAIFLASCSPRTGLFVQCLDEEMCLEPYVDAFMADAARLGVDLPKRTLVVGFSDDTREYAGVCSTRTTIQWWAIVERQYIVYVNREFWRRATEDQRMVLMYHELGHCWLDRDHTTPKSIMEPFLIQDFSSHRDYYIEELFGVTEKRSLKKVNEKLDQSWEIEHDCNYGSDNTHSH